jgi:hypothetical protein
MDGLLKGVVDVKEGWRGGMNGDADFLRGVVGFVEGKVWLWRCLFGMIFVIRRVGVGE